MRYFLYALLIFAWLLIFFKNPENKKFEEKKEEKKEEKFKIGDVVKNNYGELLEIVPFEESHAFVFDAYQDLGREHFNFIENIEKELEECEKHKEKYIEEYPGWSYDLECLEDIRVMDAEIRILKNILPQPMEEVIEEALEEMRGE